MKQFLYILIISISLTGCQQCKKDTITPKQYLNYVPTASIKPYAIFKTGTYWVYQDSATYKLDSVWVYHYSETVDTVYYKDNTYYVCPVLLYQTFSSKYRSNNYVQFNTGGEFLYKLNTVIEGVVDSTGFVGDWIKCFNPFTIGSDRGFYTSFDISVILNYYPTYNVLQQPYSSVYKYSHTKDCSSYYFISSQSYSNKTNTYYAPNIGLIRKEIPDSNKVWNLIRYHINQ